MRTVAEVPLSSRSGILPGYGDSRVAMVDGVGIIDSRREADPNPEATVLYCLVGAQLDVEDAVGTPLLPTPIILSVCHTCHINVIASIRRTHDGFARQIESFAIGRNQRQARRVAGQVVPSSARIVDVIALSWSQVDRIVAARGHHYRIVIEGGEECRLRIALRRIGAINLQFVVRIGSQIVQREGAKVAVGRRERCARSGLVGHNPLGGVGVVVPGDSSRIAGHASHLEVCDRSSRAVDGETETRAGLIAVAGEADAQIAIAARYPDPVVIGIAVSPSVIFPIVARIVRVVARRKTVIAVIAVSMVLSLIAAKQPLPIKIEIRVVGRNDYQNRRVVVEIIMFASASVPDAVARARLDDKGIRRTVRHNDVALRQTLSDESLPFAEQAGSAA